MNYIDEMIGLLKRELLRWRVRHRFKGANIGKNVKAEHGLNVKNPKYITIGDGCYFGPDCRIEAWDCYLDDHFSPSIVFGKDVRINSTCHIGCINKIEIGDQTLLGSHVLIIDHSHGKNSEDELGVHPSERRLFSKGGIVIGKRCWLCENVVILPGVHVGDESVVAANAVVTTDVPERCVVAGNPGKIVKRL